MNLRKFNFALVDALRDESHKPDGDKGVCVWISPCGDLIVYDYDTPIEAAYEREFHLTTCDKCKAKS